MSSHFIALVGEAAQVAAGRKNLLFRQDMKLHEIAPNILILTHVDLKIYRLGQDAGVVIGTLFHRHGYPQEIEALSTPEQAEIIETCGRLLIQRYWGRYIALIQAPDGLLALRDPGGMFPCHVVLDGGTLVLSSEPSLIAAAGFIKPEIDEIGLLRAISLGGLPEEATALCGVRRLLPGTRLDLVGRQVATTSYWNPWDFVKRDNADNIEDEVQKLRRVTQMSLTAWSRTYDQGLIGISGGLDSSIVAASLRKAGNTLSGLTLMTDDPLGDERAFATAVASHIGMPLFEEDYDLANIDLDRSSVAHLATPFGRVDSLAYDAALTKIAAITKSNAIFSGNGGDNIFYMSRSARALADRFISHGSPGGVLETAGDISRLTGSSVIKVMRGALGSWRMRAHGYRWQTDRTFLSQTALHHASGDIRHPWLIPPTGDVLPGKAAHIAMVLRAQYSLDAYSERAGLPVIHPLLSQPVIEHCLAIPTWLQCAGGCDRSIARQAFKPDLPAKVIERRGKGSPQGFIYQIFYRFADEIRQRILDGYLVRAGLLDRVALETALRPENRLDDLKVLRLLQLTDTEAWIRHWRSADTINLAPIADARTRLSRSS